MLSDVSEPRTRSRRFALAALAVLFLVIALVWRQQTDQATEVTAPPPARVVTEPTQPASTWVEEDAAPVVVEAALAEVDAGEKRCRPRAHGDGPSLKVTFVTTGTDEPPKHLLLWVRWEEDGEPKRWAVSTHRLEEELWLCGETQLEISRGPWRLPLQSVPRTGAVTLRLEPAPPPSQLTVTTRSPKGLPVPGVKVSFTACQPGVSDDAGTMLLDCEALDEPRRATVRAPWRLNAPVRLDPTAASVALTVLGRDEVEPGKVGLGFRPDEETPVVGVLMKGGPAERAGVHIDDEVLEVDGVGVASTTDAMARIVGAPGTAVRLKVKRGVDVLLLDVSRAP